MKAIVGNVGIMIATNTALFSALDTGQWIADKLDLWKLPADVVAAVIATGMALALSAPSLNGANGVSIRRCSEKPSIVSSTPYTAQKTAAATITTTTGPQARAWIALQLAALATSAASATLARPRQGIANGNTRREITAALNRATLETTR